MNPDFKEVFYHVLNAIFKVWLNALLLGLGCFMAFDYELTLRHVVGLYVFTACVFIAMEDLFDWWVKDIEEALHYGEDDNREV